MLLELQSVAEINWRRPQSEFDKRKCGVRDMKVQVAMEFHRLHTSIAKERKGYPLFDRDVDTEKCSDRLITCIYSNIDYLCCATSGRLPRSLALGNAGSEVATGVGGIEISGQLHHPVHPKAQLAQSSSHRVSCPYP